MLKQRYDKTVAAARGPEAVRRREDVQEKILNLDERQSKLLEAVESGVLDVGVVRRRQKEILSTQDKLRKELETLSTTEGTSTLPTFQTILGLTKSLPNAGKSESRSLLEHLAGSIKVDPRKRLLVVTWRLGGESWYGVPQFRGGAGRRVELFIHIVQERLQEYRLKG